MQGEDLKVYCKIRDSRGERSLGKHDFPILVGGARSAGIRVGGLAENEEAAYIGLFEGLPHVQESEKGIPVWHNGVRLRGSAQLHHGDRLQIGPSEILVRVENDTMVFEVSEPNEPSKTLPPEPDRPSDPSVDIEPVIFHPSHAQPKRKSPLRWLVWLILMVIFSILCASAWFVFTARQVVIRIEPEPDRISLRGGIIAPRVHSYYLLRPGKYTLSAIKECYRPLEEFIKVADEKSQTLKLSMVKLPGEMSLQVHQANKPSVIVEGAQVQIDGVLVGVTPLQGVSVEPGRRRLEISAKNYQDLKTNVDMKGCGALQSFDFALVPGWADVKIGSVPQGAMVRVDGGQVGKTPVELQLLPGNYKLEIHAKGFKTWRTQLEVKANEPLVLDNIRLALADGTLALFTKPPGANVTVGGRYVGKTPLKIPLPPRASHLVRISKAGYKNVARKLELSSAQVKELTVELVPIRGVVYLMVEPPDAKIFVNGQYWGSVRPELQLVAVEHNLEIKKEGYEPFRAKITPRPGFPKELKVALRKQVPDKVAPPPVIRAGNGYVLNLIRPGSFTMGASRREQGRRANETLRKVTLKRPLYMGVKEVTNKEFREFLAEHDSGWFKQIRLNRDELPVVQVSWEQAALFCNWLSKKESLPPSYVKRDGKWVSAETVGTGYRLPTEAEWEYCARFNNDKKLMKYPWGSRFPPSPKSGNFADASAKDLLPNYLGNYNDGYPAAAPSGVFKPNALGIYDMGGNVAEWSHDIYSIYPYLPDKTYLDPLGPKQGKHHVVRGSSWKHASISALRLSYRNYSDAKRPDLGFRICRYLDDGTEKK